MHRRRSASRENDAMTRARERCAIKNYKRARLVGGAVGEGPPAFLW